ncbi:Membrane protein, putative [Richelia intracellularis HM01]|uniref:permease n=1 Tax=Richelia intracellularis TaxID=1164990 RepID=UPI0002B5421B|nr:permease [Richelia intracellularis]CCH65916.1 Membrane protein, putative [Richelia intracellularis HM01]
MNPLNNGFTIFLSLLIEAIPFLLMGVLFSSFLLFFIDERKLLAMVPRNPLLGAIFGCMIGFAFPVCECGNVPVARRFLMQGIPVPVAIGFLLAAPTINPIVIWATWTAFREQPEIVFLRVILSFVIASIIGFVFSFQKDVSPIVQPTLARYLRFNPTTKQKQSYIKQESLISQAAYNSNFLKSGNYWLGNQASLTSNLEINLSGTFEPIASKSTLDKIQLVLSNTIQELRELGAVLVLGSALAATIQVLVSQELIINLGAGPISSILAMLALATVVSICSTVDSFFALSFASTFTSGSLLAFLVFGPMIDLKGIGLLLSIFKPKTVFYFFALAGLLTFLFTLFINLHII